MSDKSTHGGPHQADEKLFTVGEISSLFRAVADFSLLLTKVYADKSTLKLIGDGFLLTERQRLNTRLTNCESVIGCYLDRLFKG